MSFPQPICTFVTSPAPIRLHVEYTHPPSRLIDRYGGFSHVRRDIAPRKLIGCCGNALAPASLVLIVPVPVPLSLLLIA
jgi:hypothetical protein